MNSQELYKIIESELLPKCMEIMKSKGESYSGLEDKLGNFKRCAKLAGTTIEKAWFIYFCKHFDALSSYIRGEYKDSEPIEGRIQDLINYLFLLYGIIHTQKEVPELIEARRGLGISQNAHAPEGKINCEATKTSTGVNIIFDPPIAFKDINHEEYNPEDDIKYDTDNNNDPLKKEDY